jgi:hypothetical protein
MPVNTSARASVVSGRTTPSWMRGSSSWSRPRSPPPRWHWPRPIRTSARPRGVRVGHRRRPLRSWPRTAPVRQHRTGEPFGGKDMETTLETKLAAVRAAENNLVRSRRSPAGGIDRTGTGLDHHRRRGLARRVRRAPPTTLRERKQLILAVIDEIAVTVRAEQRIAQLRILWQGGAATDLSIPMNQTGPTSTRGRRGNRRPGPPARRALRRLHHRGDPGQTETPHRHRPTLHPSAGGDPARRPRHHRLPGADPMSEPTATMTSWSPSPSTNRSSASPGPHLVPLDPRRIRHRRTDHPRLRPGASASTTPCVIGSDPRFPLARPRRGRHDAWRCSTNRVAQGPTRRTASRARQPRTP